MKVKKINCRQVTNYRINTLNHLMKAGNPHFSAQLRGK